MSGYDVGDVVVCVYDDPYHCGSLMHLGGTAKVKDVLRVDAFSKRPCGCVAIVSGGGLAGTVKRFRKLDPASNEFTARIRACRPVKTEQPA